MPIHGIHHRYQPTQADYRPEERPVSSPLVRTSTTEVEPPRIQIGTNGENSAPETAASEEIPPPVTEGGDPAERALWVQRRLRQYEAVFSRREALQALADEDDERGRRAAALLRQIDQLEGSEEFESLQNEETELETYLPNSDLDGDGVVNRLDPDRDGDGLTNEREIQLGSNPDNNDSDYDGITDFGELWLREHNNDLSFLDLLRPDANGDGITDGRQIPSEVTDDAPGGILTRTNEGEGGRAGTTGTSRNTQRNRPTQWRPVASDAPRVNTSGGSRTIEGTGDAQITVSGNITFRREGRNLILNNADRGDITIQNYFNESGQPARRIFLEGTVGRVSYYNMSASALNPVTGSDGYATAGFHVASGISLGSGQTIIDPFQGSVSMNTAESTDREIVYNAASGNGTFTIPAEYKAVEVTLDGNDVLIKLKDRPNGEVRKTFRLKDGKNGVETSAYRFQLSETGGGLGQYFDASEASIAIDVTGSAGKDFISAFSGNIRGGNGSDYLTVSDGDGTVGSTIEGGDGNDTIVGGMGTDLLSGGRGHDFIISGAGRNDDTMRGGAGADTLIVADATTSALYTVSGDGDGDMSNFVGANPANDIEVNRFRDVNGMIGSIEEQIRSSSTTDEEKTALRQSLREIRLTRAEGSSSTAQTSLTIVNRRQSEYEVMFGGEEQETDIPMPDPMNPPRRETSRDPDPDDTP